MQYIYLYIKLVRLLCLIDSGLPVPYDQNNANLMLLTDGQSKRPFLKNDTNNMSIYPFWYFKKWFILIFYQLFERLLR